MFSWKSDLIAAGDEPARGGKGKFPPISRTGPERAGKTWNVMQFALKG